VCFCVALWKRSIQKSDLTEIDEIALKWGFSDKSHLHHGFRERYNCTPGDYCRIPNAK